MSQEEMLAEQQRLFEEARQRLHDRQPGPNSAWNAREAPPPSWRTPPPAALPPLPALLTMEASAAVQHVLRYRLSSFYCLGLADNASPDAIRAQYKKLALRLHPDKCEHPDAREAFDAMAEAYHRIYIKR